MGRDQKIAGRMKGKGKGEEFKPRRIFDKMAPRNKFFTKKTTFKEKVLY